MSDPLQLDQVEKETYRTFNQDGLMYLFMGLLLALVGLSLFDARFSFLGGMAALLIFPVEWVRRRITYPRIGYVKFSPPPGTARGILGFMIIAIVILTTVAFAGNGRFTQFLPLIISGVFGMAFFFGASLQGLRIRDWIVIALMVISGVVVTAVTTDWHRGTAVQLWIVAALLILMGAVDLLRFLHTYPKTSNEFDV